MRTVQRAESKEAEHPEWFSGTVWMQPLHRVGESRGADLLAVFFEAGARTRPHVHADVQVLLCVEGEGIVATAGERRLLRPGDVAVFPAGEWHWHGATPHSAMCHIAIKAPGETDWNQPERDWGTYMEGAKNG